MFIFLYCICIEFLYVYFPVLLCLSVSVKWLAVKTASEMTYIVSGWALNSAQLTMSQQVWGEVVDYIIASSAVQCRINSERIIRIDSISYHRKTAWVFCVDSQSRAVTWDVFYVGGWKCLNGSFTIQANFDESSADLKQFAVEHRGWSDSSGELNFARVFSSGPWHEKQYSGATYFQHLAESGALFLKLVAFYSAADVFLLIVIFGPGSWVPNSHSSCSFSWCCYQFSKSP